MWIELKTEGKYRLYINTEEIGFVQEIENDKCLINVKGIVFSVNEKYGDVLKSLD